MGATEPGRCSAATAELVVEEARPRTTAGMEEMVAQEIPSSQVVLMAKAAGEEGLAAAAGVEAVTSARRLGTCPERAAPLEAVVEAAQHREVRARPALRKSYLVPAAPGAVVAAVSSP